MNEWPQSLKPVAKYVARGNEVEATHPVVAFYCNLHAVKQAIRLNKGDGETFIRSLLEKTEALKKVIGSNDASHQDIVERYALEKFAVADDADVLGPVTAATTKLYFQALCFMDVCNVFKTRGEEVEKKSQFTKSRMIAIQKALREGSDPRRPEVIKAEQDELSLLDTNNDSNSASNINADNFDNSNNGAQYYSNPPPPPLSREENVSHGVGRIELNQGGRQEFPEKAPFWQTFIDPTKGDTNTNNRKYYGDVHNPPPTRPLPSLPNSANSSFAQSPPPPADTTTTTYYPTNSPYTAATPPPPEDNYEEEEEKNNSYYNTPVTTAPAAVYTSHESNTSNGRYKPSIQEVKNAQTNAKHAVSALDFSDFAGAIGFLEDAIAELKRNSR